MRANGRRRIIAAQAAINVTIVAFVCVPITGRTPDPVRCGSMLCIIFSVGAVSPADLRGAVYTIFPVMGIMKVERAVGVAAVLNLGLTGYAANRSAADFPMI